MAIKDKDGNVYKLRGPNPLVKKRSNWDNSKVKLINFGDWETKVLEDNNSQLKKQRDNIVDIGKEMDLFEGPEPSHSINPKDFIKEIEETSEPELQPELQPEPQPEPFVLNVNEKLVRALKEKGAQFYCAPVTERKLIEDDLYGSSYIQKKYGDKFIFDAIIVSDSDLQLQFWCVKELTKDSVIYKKNQQGGERWWQVTESEERSGGFLCLATVSNINPDFT